MARPKKLEYVRPCPRCGSPGSIQAVASPVYSGGELRTYEWDCGAWANVYDYALEGAKAVVDYDSDCHFIVEIEALKADLSAAKAHLGRVLAACADNDVLCSCGEAGRCEAWPECGKDT